MSQNGFFRPLLPIDRPLVTLRFEGRPLQVPAGITVAATLMANGVTRFRSTPASQAPRAPWCMMGVCFECLLEIDGVPNCQGCSIEVRDNMSIHTQEGAAPV